MRSQACRIRVLVVNDQAVMRRALCDLFQTYSDIDVISAAADGRRALDAAKGQSPDVILLDVG